MENLRFFIPFFQGVTTSKELYESVWKKVERLIEPRNNNQPTASGTNRAIDAWVFMIKKWVQRRSKLIENFVLKRNFFSKLVQKSNFFIKTNFSKIIYPILNPYFFRSEDIRSGYPFELSIVDQTFDWCGICEWHLLCRGCPIAVSDAPLDLRLETSVIPNFAIHWKPASFHLRYQQSLALVRINFLWS